jgi:hypothetical protein
MEISDSDIKLIARLVAEKLRPDEPADRMKLLVSEVARRLAKFAPDESLEHAQNHFNIRKLIINAFGLNTGGLDQELRNYLKEKNLPLIGITIFDIDKYKSLIAIIDFSKYQGDINRLKFELSEISEKFGFKSIVQDSIYYGQ